MLGLTSKNYKVYPKGNFQTIHFFRFREALNYISLLRKYEISQNIANDDNYLKDLEDYFTESREFPEDIVLKVKHVKGTTFLINSLFMSLIWINHNLE